MADKDPETMEQAWIMFYRTVVKPKKYESETVKFCRTLFYAGAMASYSQLMRILQDDTVDDDDGLNASNKAVALGNDIQYVMHRQATQSKKQTPVSRVIAIDRGKK
jgi:hypothetical protein